MVLPVKKLKTPEKKSTRAMMFVSGQFLFLVVLAGASIFLAHVLSGCSKNIWIPVASFGGAFVFLMIVIFSWEHKKLSKVFKALEELGYTRESRRCRFFRRMEKAVCFWQNCDTEKGNETSKCCTCKQFIPTFFISLYFGFVILYQMVPSIATCSDKYCFYKFLIPLLSCNNNCSGDPAKNIRDRRERNEEEEGDKSKIKLQGYLNLLVPILAYFHSFFNKSSYASILFLTLQHVIQSVAATIVNNSKEVRGLYLIRILIDFGVSFVTLCRFTRSMGVCLNKADCQGSTEECHARCHFVTCAVGAGMFGCLQKQDYIEMSGDHLSPLFFVEAAAFGVALANTTVNCSSHKSWGDHSVAYAVWGQLLFDCYLNLFLGNFVGCLLSLFTVLPVLQSVPMPNTDNSTDSSTDNGSSTNNSTDNSTDNGSKNTDNSTDAAFCYFISYLMCPCFGRSCLREHAMASCCDRLCTVHHRKSTAALGKATTEESGVKMLACLPCCTKCTVWDTPDLDLNSDFSGNVLSVTLTQDTKLEEATKGLLKSVESFYKESEEYKKQIELNKKQPNHQKQEYLDHEKYRLQAAIKENNYFRRLIAEHDFKDPVANKKAEHNFGTTTLPEEHNDSYCCCF